MTKRRVEIQDLLVWAYKTQGVDAAARPVSGPGVALMRWDVPTGAEVALDIQDDAYAVDAAVRRLSDFQRGLVISCAKTGVAPDWYPGARVIMAAVVNGRGSPARLYDDSRNVIGHRVEPAVELPDGSVFVRWGDAELAGARRQYAAWHEALAALVVLLRRPGMLEAHRVYGPAAPSMPWLDESRLTTGFTKRY